MSPRSALASVFAAALVGVALGASGCAPIQLFDATEGSGGCAGACIDDHTFDAGVQNTSATGATGTTAGSGGTWNAATGAGAGSFKYLCGGSNPECSPDPGSEDCAQGGNPGLGGGFPDASKYACQLVPNGGALEAKCGMAGNGGNGAPCSLSEPCQAGFGCVATEVTPICRQYCCDDLESCPASTYCTKAPMVDVMLDIPVCQPVTPCELLNDATCPAGQTCAIVRLDGTTSCINPGPGTDGAGCPCAPGYTCSQTDNTCLKLCHTQGGDECGPNGTCQGGTKPYPPGIGICIMY
jgi:hypothetical protein